MNTDADADAAGADAVRPELTADGHAHWIGPAPLEPLRLARTARWMVIALSGALAVVLLTSGHVVVGGLIGAMAVMRGAVLVSVQRRRTMIRTRLAARHERFQARAEAWRARR